MSPRRSWYIIISTVNLGDFSRIRKRDGRGGREEEEEEEKARARTEGGEGWFFLGFFLYFFSKS